MLSSFCVRSIQSMLQDFLCWGFWNFLCYGVFAWVVWEVVIARVSVFQTDQLNSDSTIHIISDVRLALSLNLIVVFQN